MRPFLCQKIRRIVIMDLTEKLNLVGYFEGESKQLKSVEEVADFICKNGKHGDGTVIKNGGHTSGRVTLSELSEESTVTVKLNAETIDYEIGETLTKVGKYTVTVTDECGNESVYEFEIIKAKKPVNVGLIIAFVVSMMVAVAAATFLIIKKKREG